MEVGGSVAPGKSHHLPLCPPPSVRKVACPWMCTWPVWEVAGLEGLSVPCFCSSRPGLMQTDNQGQSLGVFWECLSFPGTWLGEWSQLALSSVEGRAGVWVSPKDVFLHRTKLRLWMKNHRGKWAHHSLYKMPQIILLPFGAGSDAGSGLMGPQLFPGFASCLPVMHLALLGCVLGRVLGQDHFFSFCGQRQNPGYSKVPTVLTVAPFISLWRTRQRFSGSHSPQNAWKMTFLGRVARPGMSWKGTAWSSSPGLSILMAKNFPKTLGAWSPLKALLILGGSSGVCKNKCT